MLKKRYIYSTWGNDFFFTFYDPKNDFEILVYHQTLIDIIKHLKKKKVLLFIFLPPIDSLLYPLHTISIFIAKYNAVTQVVTAMRNVPNSSLSSNPTFRKQKRRIKKRKKNAREKNYNLFYFCLWQDVHKRISW